MCGDATYLLREVVLLLIKVEERIRLERNGNSRILHSAPHTCLRMLKCHILVYVGNTCDEPMEPACLLKA